MRLKQFKLPSIRPVDHWKSLGLQQKECVEEWGPNFQLEKVKELGVISTILCLMEVSHTTTAWKVGCHLLIRAELSVEFTIRLWVRPFVSSLAPIHSLFLKQPHENTKTILV